MIITLLSINNCEEYQWNVEVIKYLFPVWFIGINIIWFENIWYWDPNPWMHKILKFLAIFNISFKVSVWLLIYGIQWGNLGWEIA